MTAEVPNSPMIIALLAIKIKTTPNDNVQLMIFVGAKNLTFSMLCNITPLVGLL